MLPTDAISIATLSRQINLLCTSSNPCTCTEYLQLSSFCVRLAVLDLDCSGPGHVDSPPAWLMLANFLILQLCIFGPCPRSPPVPKHYYFFFVLDFWTSRDFLSDLGSPRLSKIRQPLPDWLRIEDKDLTVRSDTGFLISQTINCKLCRWLI